MKNNVLFIYCYPHVESPETLWLLYRFIRCRCNRMHGGTTLPSPHNEMQKHLSTICWWASSRALVRLETWDNEVKKIWISRVSREPLEFSIPMSFENKWVWRIGENLTNGCWGKPGQSQNITKMNHVVSGLGEADHYSLLAANANR